MKELAERAGPAWAVWAARHALGAYTLGVEEEVMLLDPRTWALAHRIDELLPRLPVGDPAQGLGRDPRLGARARRPASQRRVADAVAEIRGAAREQLERTLEPLGLRAAGLGHPPVRDLAGDRGLRRRALPVRLRVDARARAPRADLRAPRPRRRPRPGDRDPRLRPDARPPAAAARAVGQLAVLAGPRHRPRLGAHAALPGLPARRHPARVRRLRRLRRDRRPADPHAAPSPSRPSCGGTCARSRRFGTVEIRIMDAQTRCADTAALVALVAVPRQARGRGGLRHRRRDRLARRCSTRTASSPPATASTPS